MEVFLPISGSPLAASLLTLLMQGTNHPESFLFLFFFPQRTFWNVPFPYQLAVPRLLLQPNPYQSFFKCELSVVWQVFVYLSYKPFETQGKPPDTAMSEASVQHKPCPDSSLEAFKLSSYPWAPGVTSWVT